MNNRNFQKELDRIIENRENTRPRVLLHSCCGPCSSSVVEYLIEYFDVTLLWYNPNLYPEEEYSKRLAALQELLTKMGLSEKVKILIEPWQKEDYYAAVSGFEEEPEGGKRCEQCFTLRLRKCAEIAKREGFDWFCSTLTVSRHKNAILINRIGEEAAREAGVLWLPSDFKKRNGEMRSTELSEKFGIYRQLYCGCEFSLRKREQYAAEEGQERGPEH